MSNFDIYLLRTYLAAGFIIAVTAIIPQILALLRVPGELVWMIASPIASLPVMVFAFCNPKRRRNAGLSGMPVAIRIAVSLTWVAAGLLIANAAVPALRDAGLHALALTVFLATMMWAFVRRVGSLMGATPSEDWDPKIG